MIIGNKKIDNIGWDHVALIEFYGSIDDNVFKIESHPLEAYDSKKHNEQWIRIGDQAWPYAADLYSTLTGSEASAILPSRWNISYERYLNRYFNAPPWKALPWKRFHLFIHLRDHFLNSRCIEHNYIDFYFVPYADPYDYGADELGDREDIISMLEDLRPKISQVMTSIAKLALSESAVTIETHETIWEEECAPEAYDAYWIKGIVT